MKSRRWKHQGMPSTPVSKVKCERVLWWGQHLCKWHYRTQHIRLQLPGIDAMCSGAGFLFRENKPINPLLAGKHQEPLSTPSMAIKTQTSWKVSLTEAEGIVCSRIKCVLLLCQPSPGTVRARGCTQTQLSWKDPVIKDKRPARYPAQFRLFYFIQPEQCWECEGSLPTPGSIKSWFVAS